MNKTFCCYYVFTDWEGFAEDFSEVKVFATRKQRRNYMRKHMPKRWGYWATYNKVSQGDGNPSGDGKSGADGKVK